MIIDLPDTTTDKIESLLIDLKQSGNAVALGRVLTLVILGDEADPTPEHQQAKHLARGDTGITEIVIDAANEASREHPCRIILLTGAPGEEAKIDAEVRIGGDAGASEVVLLDLQGALRGEAESVIMPLLVPDTPIVAWWPHHAPPTPSDTPIGQIAKLRITDSSHAADGPVVLRRLARNYQPGDTDLAWTRLTGWRAQLAAALDLPPFGPITSAQVFGPMTDSSVLLLAAWLAVSLE
ncbi:MAG: glucose-6-phosphate dehydrogenase assembly protein OpcA, partial [Promicromonosporaceae bacterium]|nr:glucose-6-phosphate dehydrogenase assembly protein OpcA [Promicromonosporaceae bacterium]